VLGSGIAESAGWIDAQRHTALTNLYTATVWKKYSDEFLQTDRDTN